MPKYLILYRSSISPEEMVGGPPEDAQGVMEAWMNWAGKAGEALVDLGSPVMTVAKVGAGPGGSGQYICGFSIMQGDSKDSIEGLLDGHPHLQSPGDPTIEIVEYLPLPGM